MIDSLRLWLTEYDVEPGASLTVQPAPFAADSGETVSERVLWRDSEERVVSGAKAYLNTPLFNLTLAPPSEDSGSLFGGPPSLAFLQCSLPKVAGGGVNYAPVTARQAAQALERVEQELRESGVSTDIRQAVLSRVDLFKNVETREPFKVYAPIFGAMGAKRLQKRDYGTTFLWHNTQQEYCVYDKIAELEQAGAPHRGLPDNVIRFERRLLRGGKVHKELDMHTAGDMLSRYGELGERYRSGMAAELFKYQPTDVEAWSGANMERDMRYFMERYGRFWLERYLEAVGATRIAEQADIPTVRAIVERVSGNRQKAYRLGKKLEQYQLDLTMRQEAPPVTLRSLYEELRDKVLAA